MPDTTFRKIKHFLRRTFLPFVDPRGKDIFIKRLPKGAKLLDVGCGNFSPERIKKLRPDLYYVGVDVGDYNNDETSLSMADEYIITTGEDFAQTIRNLPQDFDAAISSHNIEHCNKPLETLDAICGRLKQDGRLYLAFPSEKSVTFPSSQTSTVNFYDDETHIYLPNFREIMKKLIHDNKMRVDYVVPEYRPLILRLRGAFHYHVGGAFHYFFGGKNTEYGFWEYLGFETKIWAHKK